MVDYTTLIVVVPLPDASLVFGAFTFMYKIKSYLSDVKKNCSASGTPPPDPLRRKLTISKLISGCAAEKDDCVNMSCCVSDKGQRGVHQISSGFTAVCQPRRRHRRQSYLQVCDVLRLYLTATCGNISSSPPSPSSSSSSFYTPKIF